SSRLRTVLDLNTQESARLVEAESMELGYMAPTWLSEGIDIERLQGWLRTDVESYGTTMSPQQSVDVYNCQNSLNSCITQHRNRAALFLDITVSDMGTLGSLAEEMDGQPEHASLYLPSHLKDHIAQTERSKRVIALEIELRRAECMEMLHQVRTASLQKAQTLLGKQKSAQGEITNTRTQAAITRLTT
ncbi:hypothetical protein FRC11_011668, partial [Ceratobasidium sp. 423]